MKRMLNDILFYRELTICRDRTAYISKWQSNGYQINWNIADAIVKENILEHDSGNWETGEQHYRLDWWIDENSIFDRIKFLREKIRLSGIENNLKIEMYKDISELELRYNRKIKIKKLNKL